VATPYIEDREVIRLWLKHRYEQQGFSVREFAEALAMSQNGVHRWLRDGVPVPPKYWPGITRFFGYSDEAHLLAKGRELIRSGAIVAA